MPPVAVETSLSQAGAEATADEDRRLCRLQYAAGRIESCPGPDCPFWEEGGAVLPAGCMLERLGVDLERHPEIAHALLQTRRKLAQAVTDEDEDEARSLFYRLVPAARDSVT
jgi:hypothetical protein